MSCYGCGSTFGLFKKELGCKNCGFSFCKDCLSKKAPIPKMNNEKHKVCSKCYKILTGQAQPTATKQHSPPEAYKKRMAKLENTQPTKEQKIYNTNPNQELPSQFRGMSKEDTEIARRLQNLKESKDKKSVPSTTEMEQRLQNLKKDPKAVPPPSEQEMAARLSRLKGQDPDTDSKPHVFAADRRPQAQQVDDLLQEICDEVDIDSRGLDCAADVQNRLDNYRGVDSRSSELQNNLNTPGSKDQFQYVKNIPQVDKKYEFASGEDVGWSEMNRLIGQVANEMELDARKAVAGLQKDEELWERLNKIKRRKKSDGAGPEQHEQGEQNITNHVPDATSQVENEEVDDEVEDEEACKMLIKQLLEESKLEDDLEEEELVRGRISKAPSLPKTSHSAKKSDVQEASETGDDPETEGDPDELPWCCMCNKDATLRCSGCDGDLYCKRCYKEAHDREDYSDHPTKAFKSSKKKH